MAWTKSLLLVAGLLSAVVIATPTEETQVVFQLGEDGRLRHTEQLSRRKLHGRFLHITDIHPDQYYKVHTSTEEDKACHRGTGPAGTYGAETSECDSPVALLDATLDWISDNLKDEIDFVIWTGDSARHDSDESFARDEKEVIGSNRMVANKLISTFSDHHGLRIPIVPTFGNNDILPHNIMEPGPNKWLKTYTDVWKEFIPEAQRHSFQFGGWFYTEVIPDQLAVFSLNSLYFFDHNAAIDDCVHHSEPGYKQMEWLRIQLTFLRARGMKAILMGHVPPARTSGKQLWDETCWQKYTLWLQQFRDVVVGSIYGHMNIDHFLVQDTKEVDINMLVEGTQEYKAYKRRKAETKAKSHATDMTSFDSDTHVAGLSDSHYLVQLRDAWADLPKLETQDVDFDDSGKKHKKKKDRLGGKWAERFQLTLISPSLVPNYFPSLRVFEYNITGIEDVPTWVEVHPGSRKPDQFVLGPESGAPLENSAEKNKKFIVPDPPSKTAPPGPAYSPQTLTLTGFTQYYANLTYINNDELVLTDGWSEGKHKGKKAKHGPNPKNFSFEVEYSTFDDKIYKVKDLTVRSWVDLAHRIGQVKAKTTDATEDFEDDSLVEEDEEEDDEIDAEEGKKHKKHKKKKKKHHGKTNKVWIHFLRHAFVFTKSKHELKHLD